MVQDIGGASDFLPNAKAEIACGRGPGRIHDFRPVGVPLGETVVYDGAVRNGRIDGSLGSKHDMPEANDRGVRVL